MKTINYNSIYEHTRDFKKKENINNGLVKPNLETNHNFIFKIYIYSTSNAFRFFHHIFQEYKNFLRIFLWEFKFSEDSTFEKKARLLRIDIHKKFPSHKTAEKLKMEIFYLNNTYVSKSKRKLEFLRNNGRWKHEGKHDLIQNFPNTQLNEKTVLFQAIQFSVSAQFKCQTVLFEP